MSSPKTGAHFWATCIRHATSALPLICLPASSPRKQGEARCHRGFRQLATSAICETKAAVLFSPFTFTGRSPGKGRRQRHTYLVAANGPGGHRPPPPHGPPPLKRVARIGIRATRFKLLFLMHVVHPKPLHTFGRHALGAAARRRSQATGEASGGSRQ